MSMTELPDPPDSEPLVRELRRVQSDLGFRTWTRARMLVLALVVLLDIVASLCAVYAIVQVKHENSASIAREKRNRRDNELDRCVAGNVARKAQRKLWTDLAAQNPVPPNLPGATVAEQEARARKVKSTAAVIAYVNKNFAARPC